jgi:hypothetical protein
VPRRSFAVDPVTMRGRVSHPELRDMISSTAAPERAVQDLAQFHFQPDAAGAADERIGPPRLVGRTS